MSWNYEDDIAWAETDDPRVLAVIRRDPEPFAPDGDALAPAYWTDGRRAGDVYHDAESDEIAEAYHAARDYWTNWDYDHGRRLPVDVDTLVARYLWIFYGATFAELSSSGDDVVIFDTPGFRRHVGAEPLDEAWTVHGVTAPGRGMVEVTYVGSRPDAEAWFRTCYPEHYVTTAQRITSLDGDAAEWQAFLDGDVFGVGYAVNEARTIDDGEPDIDDFDVEIECWGFAGDKYAMREAHEAADYAATKLDPILPLA